MNNTPSSSFWLRTGGGRTIRAATVAFIAAMAIAGIAAAHAPAQWRPPVVLAARAVAFTPSVAIDSDAVRARVRCTVCGIVESVLPIDGGVAAFEFRVRMRDGSVRTSTEGDAGKWRAGDAIMLIGSCVRQRTDSDGPAAHPVLVDAVIQPVSTSPGCLSHLLETS